MLAVAFPPISHLFEWPELLFQGTPFAINKVALINLAAMALTIGFFWLGGRKRAMVPTGVQNVAESTVDFVRNGVVMQTMGPSGLAWTPFLTLLFVFIFLNNITKVIPPIIMPATGRMATPLFLALVIWVIFNVVGIKNQGLGGYFKNSLFPPGLPKALYVLVTPIELVSTFLVRPFSHAVRLYANMAAGHILLATFAVLSASLWVADWYAVFLPFPFLMLVGVTLFEMLASFLQAYIFVVLAAVYIGGAEHPEH
ncbi:MAG TPA: F0F1 ATP synthase subunit A [Acidimicrobiales bacterium]|nr:F0F1 ATP synthase subunit A [Acidimicrobiales bacterium]